MTMRENLPPLGERNHFIAMAHPHAGRIVLGKAVKQIGVAVDEQIGRAVFAAIGAASLAAKVEIEDTHAVADAEKRHRQLKQLRADFRRVVLINARRPAGENNTFRLERGNFVYVEIERMDFAVNFGLADAPRDQLGVLRTEIEDENHSTL